MSESRLSVRFSSGKLLTVFDVLAKFLESHFVVSRLEKYKLRQGVLTNKSFKNSFLNPRVKNKTAPASCFSATPKLGRGQKM